MHSSGRSINGFSEASFTFHMERRLFLSPTPWSSIQWSPQHRGLPVVFASTSVPAASKPPVALSEVTHRSLRSHLSLFRSRSATQTKLSETHRDLPETRHESLNDASEAARKAPEVTRDTPEVTFDAGGVTPRRVGSCFSLAPGHPRPSGSYSRFLRSRCMTVRKPSEMTAESVATSEKLVNNDSRLG